jgi:tRNA (guanine-N7-)-methyltransferase
VLLFGQENSQEALISRVSFNQGAAPDSGLRSVFRVKTMPVEGEIEREFGVPIPGKILPEAQWARTAIKKLPPAGPLDWPAIFGRTAPVVLDLGCGNGRYTLLSALARPSHDHFALDILPVVIRYATRRGNQRGLHNARFAVKDAETFVREFVAPGSTAEAHLYHPQPYHDRSQAHRRLITPRFLSDVYRALQPRGLVVIQTDNPDYWSYIAAVMPHFFEFHEQHGPWPDAPEGRSRREILARSRNLKVFRGYGFRREDISLTDAEALAEKLPLPVFRSHGLWCDLDRLERGDADAGRPRFKRRNWREQKTRGTRRLEELEGRH